MGISIISVIVLLGVLIFFHELGHFLAARLGGVGVTKFSLGFGPKIIGRKIGATEYVLSLIPLGGYVKLVGESDTDKLSPQEEKISFARQPVWKRILIVFAGPFFNFLLAVIIFTSVYIYGVPALGNIVGEVQKDSAAYQAGIQNGDKIISIDGKPIRYWDDIRPIIAQSQGKPLEIVLHRQDKEKTVVVEPKLSKTSNILGEEVEAYLIGVSPSDNFITERRNLWQASAIGLEKTWQFCKLTVIVIGKMIVGDVSPKNLGGPIFIAQAAGAVAKEGFIPFLFLMALLSVNLAVINLFPIPILDGGHIMFNLIELARGKPMTPKWQGIFQQIGFIFLILLMIFVVMIDLDRMNLEFMDKISKFFK
ncbi:MAG TPA: RIP metalloprotease RseP [Smithellaceae bacterium]|nr:RIP metalloprotease RseP [Smithellaceae bacterium]HRS88272.1 RIP metalloprotease RseP [Smithellaceae bacterium]HRV24917.1 RIP metalloprotease RseP [Smithellaceae bacterium]